jgi:hypothetical protein
LSMNQAATASLSPVNSLWQSSPPAASGQNTIRWCGRSRHPPAVDLTIAARLNEANNGVRDYFFFPRLDRPRRHVRLRACNHRLLEAYRFGTLEPLLTLAARVSISNTL